MYWNVTIQLFKLIARLAVDWAGFFPGWAHWGGYEVHIPP